jgi:Ni2+-binding GTPase involved in maturation of urease and hydrogenase
MEDIAGVPGTGKTATVHAVVKELKRKAEDGVRFFLLFQVYARRKKLTIRNYPHSPTLRSTDSKSLLPNMPTQYSGKLSPE